MSRYNMQFQKLSGKQVRLAMVGRLRQYSVETMSVDLGEPRRLESVYRRGG